MILKKVAHNNTKVLTKSEQIKVKGGTSSDLVITDITIM